MSEATAKRLEVRKDDLTTTRVVDFALPNLGDGEILVKVDCFALTANNITYGIVGERIGYWNFFPAEDGWGVIPVWGFADVVESRHADVMTGERLYGYLPMGTHLVLQPGKLNDIRLIDAAPHRAPLPPVYNAYQRTAGVPAYDPSMDDEQMILYPLYATSYCLYDFLLDNNYYDALQIVVSSASSKTAIGLAYALADDPDSPDVVGLTSAGNREMVEALGLYNRVATYDEPDRIGTDVDTVIVDMSGNGELLSNLHALLGENMKFTSNVGLTHYDANSMGPDFIADRSAMFFAPAHIQKRTGEWGRGVFESKAWKFWHDAAMRSRDWLTVDRHEGMDALVDIFAELLQGNTPPSNGIVVKP